MSTSMKVLITLICCSFISSNAALAAPSPSFDCAKAGTNVEKAICSDEELANLDKSLSDTYISLKKGLTATEVKALKDSQRMWMKQRDTNCSSDIPCLRETYSTRLSELTRQKQLLAKKGKKYKNFVFEPAEWATRRYDPSMGTNTTTAEQKIKSILIEDNKYLDSFSISYLSVDDNRVMAKVRRSITHNQEKRTEFERLDSEAEGKLSRSETLIAVFDLQKTNFKLLWSTMPARNTDERSLPLAPLFKLDLNLDGIMDYFALTWVGGDWDYNKGSMVLRGFNGKTWGKWLEMEMHKPDYCLRCREGLWGKGLSDVKLFALDFDRNDKLDLLFWRKNYSGHPDSEEFTFIDEEFFHFEEDKGGFPSVPITEKQAKLLVKEHHLSWEAGFPTQKESSCMHSGEEKYCKR